MIDPGGWDGLFLLIGYTSAFLIVLLAGYAALRFLLGPEDDDR